MKTILSLLSCILLAGPAALRASEPIALWATPDLVSFTGTAYIGIAAYNADGISRIDFDLDGGAVTAVTAETVNPETGEYEYVFTVDTDLLTDTVHQVNAVAYSGDGTAYTMPEMRIDVVNGLSFTTRYVDSENGSDANDGTSGSPYATLQEGYNNSAGGDTLKVLDGTYVMPNYWDNAFDRYMVVRAEAGHTPVIDTVVGSQGMNMVKMVGITWDMRTAPNNVNCITNYKIAHLWYKNCTFIGRGKEDPRNGQTAFRYFYSGGHLTVENCLIDGMSRGFVAGGAGRNIIRGNTLKGLSSDAFNPGGHDILITGNVVGDIKPPNMFVENGIAGPVDVSADNDLVIHHCEWNSCDSADYVLITIPDLGAGAVNAAAATMDEIASACNAVPAFAEKMWAEVREGRLRLYVRRTNYVQHLWISGAGNTPLQFAADSYANEEWGAGAHADLLQYFGSAAKRDTFWNLIYRNNYSYKNHAQGIFVGERIHTINTAYVNNVIDGADKNGVALPFAGSNDSTELFENVLFEFNTVWDHGQMLNFNADTNATDITFRNNIFGRRAMGKGDLTYPGFDMDYNCYVSFYGEPPNVATNSIYVPVTLAETEGIFAFCEYDTASGDDTSDFVPAEDSPVLDIGSTASGIIYDLNWQLRDVTPDLGAIEYGAVGISGVTVPVRIHTGRQRVFSLNGAEMQSGLKGGTGVRIIVDENGIRKTLQLK